MSSRLRRRRRPPSTGLGRASTICAVMAVAAMAGCGVAAGPTDSQVTTAGSPVTTAGEAVASTASSAGAPGSSPATSTTAAGATATASHRAQRVAWIPFGPATVGTPVQPASWYGQLSEQRNCPDLLFSATNDAIGSVPDHVRAVYLAMAHACLALSGNARSEWSAARAELSRAGGAGGLDCLDAQIFRLASDLLAAHDADPGSPVHTGPAGRGTACRYRVAAVSPNSGTAGDELTITGDYLWSATAVYFGNVRVTDFDVEGASPEGTALQVTVPPLSGGPVRIRVVSDSESEGPVSAAAPELFTYTASSTPSASGTASPSDTATPSGSPGDSTEPSASSG